MMQMRAPPATASSRMKKSNEFKELRRPAGGFYLETGGDVTYGFVA
jgi:hypothetical protein